MFSGEKISLWDVKDFEAEMWLLCGICVAYYVTVFPFIGLGLYVYFKLIIIHKLQTFDLIFNVFTSFCIFPSQGLACLLSPHTFGIKRQTDRQTDTHQALI